MAYERRITIRIEIDPAAEADRADGAAAGLDGVDEEAVCVVAGTTAASLDGMEETLLENGYAVMRRALASHFAAVSKGGLWSGRRQAD
jgi:hypothetical protein